MVDRPEQAVGDDDNGFSAQTDFVGALAAGRPSGRGVTSTVSGSGWRASLAGPRSRNDE